MRQSGMVRFVTDSALSEDARRQRNGADDLAVGARFTVEIHHGQEIRRLVPLVPGPYEKGLVFVATVSIAVVMGGCELRRQQQPYRHNYPPQYRKWHRRPPFFVFLLCAKLKRGQRLS